MLDELDLFGHILGLFSNPFCVPQVYNPCSPQSPSRSVSISATGVPVVASAMRQGLGDSAPMYVKQASMTLKIVAQAHSKPCAVNTITVSLKTDVILYARCQPKILLTELMGLKESLLSLTSVTTVTVVNATLNTTQTSTQKNLAIQAVGGGAAANLAAVAEWKNQSLVHGAEMSSLQVSITASEVAASTALTFQFSITNPKDPTEPLKPPTAEITGIGMRNITMDRPHNRMLWPVTVEAVVFEKSSIVQSSPFPAALNTLTITLAVSTNIGDCLLKFLKSQGP